jgi:hypothetical protein
MGGLEPEQLDELRGTAAPTADGVEADLEHVLSWKAGEADGGVGAPAAQAPQVRAQVDGALGRRTPAALPGLGLDVALDEDLLLGDERVDPRAELRRRVYALLPWLPPNPSAEHLQPWPLSQVSAGDLMAI